MLRPVPRDAWRSSPADGTAVERCAAARYEGPSDSEWDHDAAFVMAGPGSGGQQPPLRGPGRTLVPSHTELAERKVALQHGLAHRRGSESGLACASPEAARD